MIFLFVRHGLTDQTASGLEGKATHDDKLNAKGILQAINAAEICTKYKPKRVYASPYKRTLQTAEIIAEKSNSELIVAYELKEYQVGEWGNLSLEEGRKKFIDAGMWNYNEDKYEFRPPGGESWKDVYERTTGLVDKIIEASQDDDTVVLVSHNGALKTLIGNVQGKGLKDWLSLRFDVGSVSGFEYIDGNWSELFVNKN